MLRDQFSHWISNFFFIYKIINQNESFKIYEILEILLIIPIECLGFLQNFADDTSALYFKKKKIIEFLLKRS